MTQFPEATVTLEQAEPVTNDAIEAALTADPGRADRSIARELGINHRRVGRVRRRLEEAGRLAPRELSRGRVQPDGAEGGGRPTTPEEWEALAEALDREADAAEADLEETRDRRAGSIVASKWDEAARRRVVELGRRIEELQALADDSRAGADAARETARRLRAEAKARAREEMRAKIADLLGERLAAAQAVDEAAAALGQALRRYRAICAEQSALAAEVGDPTSYRYNHWIVEQALRPHLAGLGVREWHSPAGAPLVEADGLVRREAERRAASHS